MGARIVCWDVYAFVELDPITLEIELLTREAGRHFDAAYAEFVRAVHELDDAFLAQLLNDPEQAVRLYDAAIAAFARSRQTLGDTVNALRKALGILLAPSSEGSFSVQREAFFALIDYDAMLSDLEHRGATVECPVFWDEVAGTLRDGAGKAGLRLFIEEVVHLRIALNEFRGQLVRRRPTFIEGRLLELVRSKEFDMLALVPGLIARWTRLEWHGIYITLIFKEAARLLA